MPSSGYDLTTTAKVRKDDTTKDPFLVKSTTPSSGSYDFVSTNKEAGSNQSSDYIESDHSKPQTTTATTTAATGVRKDQSATNSSPDQNSNRSTSSGATNTTPTSSPSSTTSTTISSPTTTSSQGSKNSGITSKGHFDILWLL